jgi:hypothetical protein
VEKEAKHYGKKLLEEVNAIREEEGKKAFNDKDEGKGCEKKIEIKSTSDPESGLFHKGEHKKCFAYSAHTVCEKNNFVLSVELTAGNIHDSVAFDGVYEEVKSKYGIPESVVADAGYRTPWICKQILEDNAEPIMPYKRPMRKKGYYGKNIDGYVYDEYYDCYLCPENQCLEYSTTNREGYREYKSDKRYCEHCPNRAKCTGSKEGIKIISRHIWQDCVDTMDELRRTPRGKALYETRGQTIERIFADAKEKHGMRYTRLKGLNKVKTQVVMTFAVMNLKKLTKLKEMFGFIRSFLQKLLKSKQMILSF